MSCELQYRLIPLEDLIAQAQGLSSGALQQTLKLLARELAGQIAPNAEVCMRSALDKSQNVPVLTGNMLRLLGRTLGKFDLHGQLAGINAVLEETDRNIHRLSEDRSVRLRSYRTLGVCAGVAIVILLI